MALPSGDYFPDGLHIDAEPEEHAKPVPFQRRRLTPVIAVAAAQSLRSRASAFRQTDALQLIQALDRVHAAWSTARSPLRREAVALLRQATGYPEAVIDRHLRKTIAGLRSRVIRHWMPHIEGAATYGPELTVVVSSGNIPGAALPSVVQALLLRSPCLVKTSSAEPILLPLYARSLAEQAPEIARYLVVTGWEGGDTALETALIQEADALVAYGSDAALSKLRSHLPAHARFIGYGHRISFSAIARECLTRRAARRLATGVALDAAVFDQQGCLSPQAVYVERGGDVSPDEFGELVARELVRLERLIPRRKLSPAEASAIHQYRTDLEMRAFADASLRLWSSAGGTAWTVAVERNAELLPCPLNRTMVLRPVDTLEQIPACVAGARGMLLSAGLEAPPERRDTLTEELLGLGVTRITRVGHAQRPTYARYHDGIDAIAALTRAGTVER